jgi:cell division protein FtsQ
MDRGGRFSRPLNSRPAPPSAAEFAAPSRTVLFLRRTLVRLSDQPRLRRAEFALLALLLVATGIYGAHRGGHIETLADALRGAGDSVAREAGFGISEVEVRGIGHLAREQVLREAGVTENSSLLLLDADRVRAQLKRNPWIAQASVRKLYPDRLEIEIEERTAFALWQRGGKLHLIARDGTVLESPVSEQRNDLLLVVGIGAEKRAGELIDLIGRFPLIAAELRAGILVAERRWNLRLKNGIDVRLPEEEPAVALARLTALQREKQILSRDLTMIDLRSPDRIAVGLSDEAAAARAAAEKQRPGKRKGADT